MATHFNPIPDLPPEIVNAAQSGELVVFAGAGISRLIRCPSWNEFANNVLDQLVPKGLNYYDLSQIQGIADPKKRLSIAKIVADRKGISINYDAIFKVTLDAVNVYSHLNSFNSSFVTTNYEKYLSPISQSAKPEETWRFFRINQLLGSNLDQPGNVIHLHGCINDPRTLIVTTKDYLEHYARPEVQEFLTYLFDKKTVLFLGYGLEETEVLEYILRRGQATGESGRAHLRRFILQGFFNAEMPLFELLRDYYIDAFATDLIGFPKDSRSHAQQVELLEMWSKRLRFEGLALADEAAAMLAEING